MDGPDIIKVPVVFRAPFSLQESELGDKILQ